MFTGIVEETGLVKELKKTANCAFLTISCEKVLEDVKLGDSLSINGVCQTVVGFDNKSFSVEVSSETLKVTAFSKIKTGEEVNLERALMLCSRLGGHLVSGHIDDVATLKKVQKQGDFYNLKFEFPAALAKYIVKKGSVTLNGISLTVASVCGCEFDVAVIPHTYEHTNLNNLKTGDVVNLECDILSKYVEKILLTNNNGMSEKTNDTNVDVNFLKEHGFL